MLGKWFHKNKHKVEINAKKGIRLSVGCGQSIDKNWVGIDIRDYDFNIVHDLEVTPWPLEDSCCNVIVCSHILEHITPKYFIDVMNEIHRVGKPGCEIMIASPYGVSPRFVQDPTHCNPISEVTLKYFDPKESLYNIYKPSPFNIEQCGYDLVHDIHAVLTIIKEEI